MHHIVSHTLLTLKALCSSIIVLPYVLTSVETLRLGQLELSFELPMTHAGRLS